MTPSDHIISAIRAQSTPHEKVAVLIASLKHMFAEALRDANLPQQHQANLAAIFPDLEANTLAIAEALAGNDTRHPDAFDRFTGQRLNGPAYPAADAPLPLDSRDPRSPNYVKGDPLGTGGMVNDPVRLSDRDAAPAPDALALRGDTPLPDGTRDQAAPNVKGKPDLSGKPSA